MEQAAGVAAQMPQYQSHKKVWALKIRTVQPAPGAAPGTGLITPEDTTYAPFTVDAAYMAKHDPQPGGYYVVYPDGYKSFSPAEPFESGYTIVSGRSANPVRLVTEHIVNFANDRLRIVVLDQPGHGGANHAYEIRDDAGRVLAAVSFQNGPIGEAGINGVTHEALLAIVADRLRSFQSGQYKCKENACSLTHIEEALHWLQQRTIVRMRRGVEGTHQV